MAPTKPPTATGLSRRAVLGRVGAGIAGLGAATGTATAQEESITTRAVILAPDRYERDELRGFFLHVDPETDPTQAPVADDCEWAAWPPEKARAYDAQLIDRKGADHSSEANQLYVSAERSITPGALYVINNRHRCTEAYVGVELEQIAAKGVRGGGANVAQPGQAATTADGGDTDVFGPGFGLVGGLVGLLGAGLLRRVTDSDRTDR